jgi:periplasmic protein TonB
MTVPAATIPAAEGREWLRWVFSAALVLCAHGAIAAAMVQWSDPEDASDVGGAIVIELAPVPVAPMEMPNDMIPGPEQIEAEIPPEKPVEKVEEKIEDKIEQAPDPEIELAIQLPEPKPDLPVPEVPPAPMTTALLAPPVPQQAETPVAPLQAMPRVSLSNALPAWKNEVADMLERNKRYPADARNRHQQGTVQLAFSIDREGRVVGSRIVTSSGSPALDKEALDLAKRASPFPPPPRELAGEQINLSVPIRFNIK